jgi:predicted N-acyltransferase
LRRPVDTVCGGDYTSDMSLRVALEPKIEAIDATAWDALAGDDDPFIEHAFLLALEQSGSVGGHSGWIPLHVTVHDGSRLVGALPLYVKLHGYGEYIFDWRWAASAERAGLRYYPKLVSTVPFTPATGKRVLWASDTDRGAVVNALLQGVASAREELSASSVHLLFLNDEERAAVGAHPELMPRESLQFHWHNDGYASFDDYLSRFRSALRKQVRRERKQVSETGLEVRIVPGPELTGAEWSALFEFYVDTCQKRGSGPYLNEAFFELIRKTHAQRVLAVLAYRAGRPIAGTFNFQKGKHLYGRYWGCSEEYASLHFECCYYRLIEHAIGAGMTRFEAGAQGTHKLRRGLMPVLIHSAHQIVHPALRRAVAADLVHERDMVRSEMAALAMHGPFKRDGAD